MKIQILNKTDYEINFLVTGINAGFANTLRTIMISETPTLAIEWVDFVKNDSVLNDEIIASRLGQIPLIFDQKAYNLPSECDCEGKGCSRCQVKFVLKKKGPCMVYSEDLKTRAKDVKPLFEKIPIVELFEDQELELEAIAQLGFGKKHAKWQGAVVGYKNLPKITVNVKDQKDFEKYVKACPSKLFKIENGKLIVTNPLDCNLCMQCAEIGEVKVEAVEDSFVFNVESVCGLKAEKIVLTACEILEKKLKEFEKNLKK